ncbi:MAG: hypothetical protein LBV09_07115, partial [Deferribacteraceae bacterium]|nr:hypothetical protein [Deferribacteraceae bacterium]
MLNDENVEQLTVEYINSLPILRYAGNIEIVSTPYDVDELMRKLRDEPSVGFDTESRPSFVKGKTYPVSLIQLATPKNVYIVRFGKTGFTDSLAYFMESNVEKIGVG